MKFVGYKTNTDKELWFNEFSQCIEPWVFIETKTSSTTTSSTITSRRGPKALPDLKVSGAGRVQRVRQDLQGPLGNHLLLSNYISYTANILQYVWKYYTSGNCAFLLSCHAALHRLVHSIFCSLYFYDSMWLCIFLVVNSSSMVLGIRSICMWKKVCTKKTIEKNAKKSWFFVVITVSQGSEQQNTNVNGIVSHNTATLSW
jgi:hypothetical protein